MGKVKDIFTSRNSKGPTESDLNALFAEFFDRLVYFSFQLIKDKDHARDIAQDAFIKYWNARETVAHNPAAVKNYLYSTVRNDSLNAIRHSKVVTGYIDMQDKGEPEVASIIEAIISAEVMAELHTALQSLPSTYRTVSTMSYLDGKKNQEIADELNMSVNTIKKQKQKAMQLLRLRLEPEIFVVMFAVSFLLIR